VHFPSLSSAGERPVATEGYPLLLERGLGGKLLLGKKSESGVAEAL